MTSSKESDPIEEFGQHLRDSGFSRAVIIDDAYDNPTVDSLLRGEIGDFWNMVEREQDLLNELSSLGLDISDEEDINDTTLSTFWDRRSELDDLRRPVEDILFATKIQKQEELEPLRRQLTILGIKVEQIGQKSMIENPPPGLVFLDYRLGPATDPQSVNNAIAKARDIYDQVENDADKPFIVLISAGDVGVDQFNEFRDESGLLGGLFDFVPKEEFNSVEKLNLRLAIWVSDMPTRHKIQRFVESLEKSVKKNANEFVRRVKSLAFEDYAYVQQLSLDQDGQPLGDYVFWLFGALLEHCFFEFDDSMRSQRIILDQLDFEEFLPSQRPPSTELAKVYRLAVSEPIYDEMGVHTISDDEGREFRLPILRLGDLLIKDANLSIYMVANPDCDLAYSPGVGRGSDPNFSVFLIPGELRSQNDTGGSLRTEFFQHDGSSYRIFWDAKGVMVKTLGEFMNWYTEGGYSRPQRIRLPFALQIQQRFTANIARVGMPVSPPRFEYLDVEIFCDSEEGKWEKMGPSIKDGIAIFRGRDAQGKENLRFFLTGACAHSIIDRLSSALQIYEKRRDHADAGYTNRLNNRIENIRKCQADPRILIDVIKKTWDFPGTKGNRPLASNLIVLYRSSTLVTTKSSSAQHSISLNVEYNEHKTEGKSGQ